MDFIEQYDEENDYYFEIPEIEIATDQTIEDFLNSEDADLYAALLSALYNAITLGFDTVPVFAVKYEDNIVNINREEYPESLDNCLKYFTKLEEYELCQVLADLKKKL